LSVVNINMYIYQQDTLHEPRPCLELVSARRLVNHEVNGTFTEDKAGSLECKE